jgi:hypothetical protein
MFMARSVLRRPTYAATRRTMQASFAWVWVEPSLCWMPATTLDAHRRPLCWAWL